MTGDWCTLHETLAYDMGLIFMCLFVAQSPIYILHQPHMDFCYIRQIDSDVVDEHDISLGVLTKDIADVHFPAVIVNGDPGASLRRTAF